MPPVRRSLRERNRTAIEQPYQSEDGHEAQTGHPDTGAEPTPVAAGQHGRDAAAQAAPSSGRTTTAGEDEPPHTTKATPAAPDATDDPNPSQSPSDTPSQVPSHTSGQAPGDNDEVAGDAPDRAGASRRPGARKGRDGAAQAAREGATNIPVARILYLPEDLIEPLRIYRATHGLTNTQVALRALNATYRQIPDLIEREPRRQVITGDLFDEVIAVPTRSNRQVEITPTAAQLDTIDPLVRTTGANDRSHLFALAIRQFLTDAGLIHQP